jgi:proteasome lid subunit RPN8/RPN11
MWMARPKIVKETKRRVPEVEPPSDTRVRPHEWLSDDEMTTFEARLRSRVPFEVYISSSAEKKIRDHAEEHSAERLEVLGFLLGEIGKWKGKTYTVVRDAATTALRSSPSNVRFAPEAYPRLFHQLDDSGFDYIIVGWYHSHPGHTCFMSRTDVETQRASFREPFHVAFVIDPINREAKTFRLAGEGYEETTFAIYASSARKPDRSQRTRKLKVKPVVAH